MKQPHTVSCWKGGNSRPHLFHLKKPAVITKTTARGKKTIIYNNYIHVQHAFRRRAAHIVRHSAFTWGSAFLLPKSSKLIGTYWHILTLRTPYLGPDGPPNPLDQPLDPPLDPLHDPPLEPDLVGAARWPIIWEAATPTPAQWIQRTSPILVREVVRDGRRHASTGDRAVKSQGVETLVEQWTPLEPLVELPFEKKSHDSICFCWGFEAVIPFFLGNGTKLGSSGNLMKPSPQKKSPWNPATVAPGDVIAGDVELEFVAIVPMIRQYLCLHLIVVLHPSHLGWKMLRSSTHPRSEVPQRGGVHLAGVAVHKAGLGYGFLVQLNMVDLRFLHAWIKAGARSFK